MTSQELMDKISTKEEIQSQFYKELSSVAETKNKLKCIELLMNHYNCGFDEAREVMDFVIDGTPIPNPDLTPQQIAAANAQAQEWLNKPKCPICNSTNLSKLSNVGKVAKVGLFGIFGAGDIGKTWKCNNCGSKF